MSQPNVLFLFSDQHNAKFLGCAGHEVAKTPHLDALAKRGVRFTSAYAQNTICTPSRMSYLCGQYVHNHGYYGLMGPTPTQLPSIFQQLRGLGYYTGAVGKIHVPDGWIGPQCDFIGGWCINEATSYVSHEEYLAQHGYADYVDQVTWKRQAQGKRGQSVDGWPDPLPKELSREGYTAAMAREFLAGRQKGQPFFLWYSIGKPHQHYNPAQEFWDLYPGELPMPPSADDDPGQHILPMRRTIERQREYPPADLEPGDYQSLRQRKLHGYYGNVSHMDWAMGEALAMLDEMGERENTLVIYTADHGDFACEHGILEKAPGISSDAIGRVPMIWSWPGRLPEGQIRDQLVESVDLWPTINALLGLPDMQMWDGHDISQILIHDGPEVRAEAFTENPFIKTITTRRWRMTYVPISMYPGDPIQGELYDRDNDPWERQNLYHDPAYAQVVRDLRERVADWAVTTLHPVTAHPVLAHPALSDAKSTETALCPPFPEDGRTAPVRLRQAIAAEQDNYL